MSKRSITITVTLLLTAVAIILINRNPHTTPPAPTAPTQHKTAPAPPTIGEEILAGYADPNTLPKHDLELADRLLFSYRTLVKNHTDKPVGTNADFVDALLGDNPAKQVFLPPDSPHISPAGELLDRWRTPLFIHPESSDRITLRSAGPDKTLWTDDDIVRQPQ